MTLFYYYVLILTLGLFMYYAALIAKDMYGKPKGEGNTSENIETDGMSEEEQQDNPPSPSHEAKDDDSDADTDDESGSREWNEENDGKGNDEGSEENHQEENDQNPDDIHPENAVAESEDQNDEPEHSEKQQPSPRPYYEEDDEDTSTGSATEDDEDDTPSQGEEEAVAEDHEGTDTADNDNNKVESQENQFSPSALGLTPELIAYMEAHGSMVVDDAKPVEDLDLTIPEPEPEYEVSKTYEPSNEDAQMVAAKANSCQESITPKSDDEIPCGILSKTMGKRVQNAISEEDTNVESSKTNNILSHDVRDRC